MTFLASRERERERERQGVTYSFAVNCRRLYLACWSQNIDAAAIVGSLVPSIVFVGARNDADVPRRRRRSIRQLLAVVAGRYPDKDVVLDEPFDRLVGRQRHATADADVDEDALGATPRPHVSEHQVCARDEHRHVGPAPVRHHLDAVQTRLLGHAIRLAADDARYESAVAPAVRLLARDEGVYLLGSALEFLSAGKLFCRTSAQLPRVSCQELTGWVSSIPLSRT